MKNSIFPLLLTLTLVSSVWAKHPLGDLNGDYRVDFSDVWLLAARWLDTSCLAPDCPPDLDGIAGVSMPDFALLAENWLTKATACTLVINEFMAKNDGSILDEHGDYDDWIEIYNYGHEAVDIGRMYLSDNLTADPSRRWRVSDNNPSLTTIPSHGYLLIWADDEASEGILHASFKLSTDGEEIGLYDAGGNLIDSITFGPQNGDESYGRLPDGSDNWQVLTSPTPGASNTAEPVGVIISEIMYHPYHALNTPENMGQEYIELFNRGAEPVNLSGWRLTDGVDFTFPQAVLGAGQYLVVAADVNAFTAKYPDVSNVVGGWSGRLSNRGEAIELVDTTGVRIDWVRYADEGDWAVRQLGAVDYGHRGWMWSDEHDGGGKSLELINPALPNEYGQNWAASKPNHGTPGVANSVSDSDIAPLIVDVAHFPIIPSSAQPVTVTARIVDELKAAATVTLHYRVDASVYESRDVYPHHDPNSYTELAMFDDGQTGSGASGDGVYAAEIPAHPDGTIIEFYIEASDAGSNIRTWPAPSLVDGVPEQVTNALYQVGSRVGGDSFDADGGASPTLRGWTAGSQPIYYLIMTEMEKDRLLDIGDREGGEHNSDAQMNATFVSLDGIDIKVCHNVALRNRGHGTRDDPPNNYRVNFPDDRPYKGVTAINVNSKYTYVQLAGSALFRLSGLPQPDATAVQERVNGQNLAEAGRLMYGSYVHVEVIDSDYADKHFPQDGTGNAYKCMRDISPADLRYEGLDPNSYRDSYFKSTNTAEDDWSDLIELCYVLSDNTPDDIYVDEVSRVLNVEQWLRFLAINALLDNRETTLANGVGDDYYLYRGIEDPRFVLIQHDLDSIFGYNGGRYDRDIFQATGVAVLDRFLKHPQFVRRYYFHLKNLIGTTFSAEQLGPFLDTLLGHLVPTSEIDQMKNFVAQRNAHVLSLIPSSLTIQADLPQAHGYYVTNSDTVVLYGTADAVETCSVLANGRLTEWSQIDGKWSLGDTAIGLYPGINRAIIQTFDGPDGTGRQLQPASVDIWYEDGDVSEISGTLTADTTLDAESGPWHVTGDLLVPAGVTLTIEKGTTVFFDAARLGGQAGGITVNGRLIADGSDYERIRLTRVPGDNSHWNGLVFSNTLQDNRLCYVDMEFGDGSAQAIKIDNAQLLIDNLTWTRTSKNVLDVTHPRLIVRNSVFPDHDNEEQIYGRGLTGSEYLILEGNTFGRLSGYQDAIDFADCHRPEPIIQVYNNVFLGGEDDGLDLDNADAHIEGNVFMNFLGGSGTGTANPIAADQGSQVVVVRNVFYNNISAVLVKGSAEVQAQYNTFVGQTGSVINFFESGSGLGKAAYLDGNIFWNNASVLQNVGGQVELAVHRSIISAEWHHFGQGNIDADPLFVDQDKDFRLKPMSPAVGAGPCGLDMGAYVPSGAAICGEPNTVTYRTDAVLAVGGPGITHYKYAINDPNGAWSQERPVDVPIELTGLIDATSYTVYVLGRNSAGVWQSSPVASRTWTVDTSYRRLVINEVLSSTHGSDADGFDRLTTSLIELYYDGPVPMDLSGMSLTDDPVNPTKFVFSNQTVSNTTLNPGAYMVLYGDFDTQLKDHVGFALSAEGEGLYLYDKPSNGGGVVDAVVFGPQINSFSIGRIGYGGQWKLTVPTFGQANIAAALGDPDRLRINEWLTDGEVLFENDFIELYNPHPAPVELSGLYLTDNPIAQPDKHRIISLSFIAGGGFAVFIADGSDGPNHVDFRLSADGGMIALLDCRVGFSPPITQRWGKPHPTEIDKVIYGPQTTDVSQGRAPDGAKTFEFFELPNPGVANPASTTVAVTFVAENADKQVLVPSADIGDAWRSDPDFNDLDWSVCSGIPGGVGYERGSGYEPYLSLDVEDQMYNRNDTCYIRIPFSISDDPGAFTKIVLAVRYDDGFVAYINGTEVARRNFSGTPSWNSGASATHSDSVAVLLEEIDISSYTNALRAGNNLLAIAGLNNSANRSDFLISAEMDATITTSHDEYLAKAFALLHGLRITELMYHAARGNSYDYIEIQNIGDATLDMTGVRFIEGVEFTFPAMELEPGQYVVVCSNITAFESEYGAGVNPPDVWRINVTGPYTENLSNSGEKIVLALPWPLEAAIMRFEYNDAWYPLTDGLGKSLQIRDPTAHPATWNLSESWKQSDPTPGRP